MPTVVLDSSTERATALRHYLRRSALDPRVAGDLPERLDRRSEPIPFRRYDGARRVDLARSADDSAATSLPWSALRAGPIASAPLDAKRLGACLDDAVGLVGWRERSGARFGFRVNPSAGNRQPLETFLVTPTVDGLSEHSALWHLDVFGHALEARVEPWDGPRPAAGRCWVLITALVWRTAWKYGERALRLALLDAGHAVEALAVSAALRGWWTRRVEVADATLDALLGVDRDVERAWNPEVEVPLVLVEIGPEVEPNGPAPTLRLDDGERARLAAVPRSGRPSAVSPSHRRWPALVDALAATRRPVLDPESSSELAPMAIPATDRPAVEILRGRRSHARFDPEARRDRRCFLDVLGASTPSAIRRLVLVHRIDGLEPGLYAADPPDGAGGPRAELRDEHAWQNAGDGLWLLAPGDARRAGTHLAGDQPAGGEGLFTVLMLAPLAEALVEDGEPWRYRDVLYEAGAIGHRLYLAATAVDLVATGLGGFWDRRAHDWLGLAADPDDVAARPFGYQLVYGLAVGVALRPSPSLESSELVSPDVHRGVDAEPLPASRGGYRAVAIS